MLNVEKVNIIILLTPNIKNYNIFHTKIKTDFMSKPNEEVFMTKGKRIVSNLTFC